MSRSAFRRNLRNLCRKELPAVAVLAPMLWIVAALFSFLATGGPETTADLVEISGRVTGWRAFTIRTGTGAKPTGTSTVTKHVSMKVQGNASDFWLSSAVLELQPSFFNTPETQMLGQSVQFHAKKSELKKAMENPPGLVSTYGLTVSCHTYLSVYEDLALVKAESDSNRRVMRVLIWSGAVLLAIGLLAPVFAALLA